MKKRENFHEAFQGFDPRQIATWGDAEVERLLPNAGIIRHRGKIEATIRNARAFLELDARVGFDQFLWNYFDGVPLQNQWTSRTQVPAKTALTEQMSRDLKREGFSFCGPTIVYAFAQACGLINDHLVGCPRHAACAALARGR